MFAKVLKLRVICVALLLIGSLLLANCGGEGKKVIEIGVLTPLSGPAAAAGIATQQGMDLAVEEINKSGGVLGKEIKLIYEDDAMDPKQSIAKVEKLLGKDEVKYLIGGLASGVTIAIADTVKKYKPIMAWIGAASRFAEDKYVGEDWFFHYHPWEYHNIKATSSFFKSTGAKTIAILYEDSAFGSGGQALAVPMFQEDGLKIVVNESFKSGSPNFTPLLTKVKNANPDILYVICYGADVIPLMNAVKELNVNPKMIYPVPPSWPSDFAKMPISEYVAALNFWTADVPTQASKDFVAKFKAKYGKEPQIYWQPLGYTNVISLAKAINDAGTEDQAAVIAALEKQDITTPVGQLSFKPSLKIKHQGFTKWLSVQFRSGKMEIVYPASLKTKELVYPMPKWDERK